MSNSVTPPPSNGPGGGPNFYQAMIRGWQELTVPLVSIARSLQKLSGSAGVVALQQGTQYAQGVVQIGPYLELNGQTLNGEVYAPLVNGDLPGPTPIADPYGQFIMAQIR
jgi:hypothetical protein